MNPIATRLLNQQLICPQFSDPADVVCHMGAIQAQEYRMMRWAVAMRTSKPSSKAFKQALLALAAVVCPQGEGGDSRVDAEQPCQYRGG